MGRVCLHQCGIGFFIGEGDFKDKQKTRHGLVLIDIFSKHAVTLPIPSKKSPEVLAGMLEGIQKMGEKPKIIFADEEGSLIGTRIDIRGALKYRGVELYTTRGYSAFVERFIRTLKDMLFKRVEADEKRKTISRLHIHVASRRQPPAPHRWAHTARA